MKKIFAHSIFALLTLTLLALFNPACGPGILEQGQKNVLEPPQKIEPSSAKTEESIFTVIETEDLEYPTLVAAIHLPFHANPNNTVVLAGQHAYVTTEKHLHVIDVSVPQRPVYLTSLSFLDEIGKILVSGHHIIIASPEAFHIVDVSQPSQPVLESTMQLPQRKPIKNMDIRDAHLYVLGENDALYIFPMDFGQARLVKMIKLNKRWWLLSPKVEATKVKQYQFPGPDDFPSFIYEPLLSQRGFLEFHPSKDGKIRSSPDFLVATSLFDKRHTPSGPSLGLCVIDACKLDSRKIRTGVVDAYNMETECRGHFSATGKKIFTRQKPTITYAIVSGRMQHIAPKQLGETIEVKDEFLVGHITDFQISEDLLYVVNEKGFFSIIRVVKIEEMEKRGKFLSATPLQASRPISLAVGKHYVCVLASLPEK